MPEAIRHPVTGDPIELADDERLCRIGWPEGAAAGALRPRGTIAATDPAVVALHAAAMAHRGQSTPAAGVSLGPMSPAPCRPLLWAVGWELKRAGRIHLVRIPVIPWREATPPHQSAGLAVT